MDEYIKKEAVLGYLREKERIADEAAQSGKATFFDAIISGIAHGCIEDISKIPAADVVEVRHGEWKTTSGAFAAIREDGEHIQLPTSRCSKCKEIVVTLRWRNFCPHCGADMREETK